MLLLFLLALLIVPYLLLGLAGRWVAALNLSPAKRARVGLSLFFAFTSIGHVIFSDEMSAMLPPSVPYRLGIVYLTGVLELLGAVGVWVPGFTRLTGVYLILMLAGFLPANIYAALNRLDFGGHAEGPVYLLWRVPFQIFVMWWAYFATNQRWFARQPK